MSWVLVFLGGGLGSLARYGLARWLPTSPLQQGHFPWATLLANCLACLLLGCGIALVSKNWLDKSWQLFLLTGFCGGFSTFSTYVSEWLLLGEHGHSLTAALYLFASLLSGGLSLWIALWLIR